MSEVWPRESGSFLKGPMGASALLHIVLVVVLLYSVRPQVPVKLPPSYKVNIVAAPPGPRAIGEVRPPSAPPAPPAASEPAVAPRAREIAPTPDRVPVDRPAPSQVPARVTPNQSSAGRATPNQSSGTTAKTSTSAPAAGGGPVGGKGSDVANVQTGGVDFPYPGYLNNIVRQIALNFKPSNSSAPLRAEISFKIRRDGTVVDIQYVTRSGVYSFDLEARGAIEKAAKSFGPLPDGFSDDVLPIFFSFDPKFLR